MKTSPISAQMKAQPTQKMTQITVGMLRCFTRLVDGLIGKNPNESVQRRIMFADMTNVSFDNL